MEDFNDTNMKAVLPKFHKNIHMGTQNGKTLDQVYTKIMGGYKAHPVPHLWSNQTEEDLLVYSDHSDSLLSKSELPNDASAC